MNLKVSGKGVSHLFVKRCNVVFWHRRLWLNKTQWLQCEELEAIQLKLLKDLIDHCYCSVPYYREVMNRIGVKPEDIQTLEDIKLFPVLTKKDVLKAGSSLYSRKYPIWLTRTAYTGGTTGTPLEIRRDIFSIGNNHAFYRRQWDWAGLNLSSKCAYLTGDVIVEPDDITSKLYAYDPFMKELILSTYHLTVKTAEGYVQAMKQYKVKAIVGYPSAVYLLARACLDKGIKCVLKAALTSSETLTDSMRNTISQAFGCRVYDYYGSAERTCDIQTCEQGSYHVIPEYGLTELLDIDNSGDGKCRLVTTGFWNRAMPLVRYDMNDVAIRTDEKCTCGRCFPVIKKVSGRKADVIKTPSGREFGAAILTHLLYGTNHIAESQIVQDAIDHICIKYVRSNAFCSDDLDNLKNLIAKHLPTELKVDIEEVGMIERTKSGKLRPVVSHL